MLRIKNRKKTTAPEAEPIHAVILTLHAGTCDGIPLAGTTLEELRRAALETLHNHAREADRPVQAHAHEPGGTWSMTITPNGTMTTAPLTAKTPAPPLPAHPPVTWHAPLPTHHTPAMSRLRAAEQAGDYLAATQHAEALHAVLSTAHGPHHPHAVNLLTLRAWLALHQADDDPHAAVDLLTRAATTRHQAGAPQEDTHRAARNAHALWHRLRNADPTEARDLGERLVLLLDDLQEQHRAAEALDWLAGRHPTPTDGPAHGTVTR